jgi:hypothetical protein
MRLDAGNPGVAVEASGLHVAVAWATFNEPVTGGLGGARRLRVAARRPGSVCDP